MTWNMLVTQAAYSFAQARGQRTGKNLSSALVTKPGPSWPQALSRPRDGRGGAGSWQWGGVDGEGVQWVSGSQVSDAPLIIFTVACSAARDRAWTSSVGLCSVPSDAALSWPDPMDLFLTLLPRNAARWWNSESISGPYCLPRSNSWSSYRYHLGTPVVNNAVSVQDFRRRQWHPTPVLLPGKSHRWRSLVGCSLWSRWESGTTEQLHFHFSLPCTGEGNGNPLQCSCLENPRDGGTWWAAIYGVARSRTRLKRLTEAAAAVQDFAIFVIDTSIQNTKRLNLALWTRIATETVLRLSCNTGWCFHPGPQTFGWD